LATLGQEIGWQGHERIENTDRAFGNRTQDDFIAPTEDFNLIDIQAEFFGQAHSLAVAGLKDTGVVHGVYSLNVYTLRLYAAH
jgi:hypothetical protein